MKRTLSVLVLGALFCASSPSWAESGSGANATGDRQQRMQQRLQEIDSDGDGNISRAEFQAMSDKRFAAMDSNGDGLISADERKQMRQMRQERKGQSDGGSFP